MHTSILNEIIRHVVCAEKRSKSKHLQESRIQRYELHKSFLQKSLFRPTWRQWDLRLFAHTIDKLTNIYLVDLEDGNVLWQVLIDLFSSRQIRTRE